MKINAIGLPVEGTESLIKELHALLADYAVFYQNVRGYHWNIRGSQFFELHLKFEELYDDLALKVDEVAERILTLGGKPDHRFSSYSILGEVKECDITSDAKAAVKDILETLKIMLGRQRLLLADASQLGDEGTAALMGDYIRAQEKLVWMYAAFLGE
ncbi:MAG: hypothetical protein RL754_809 [Bacteroidota bacterium]|jgi:starvation-inducible DNA-binding protein